MSVNNAPGEVNKDKFFDSPNISSAEDEIEEPEVDKEAEERKKRETVEIDGVPIEGKEIKYKAEDIKKKGKMNYFVDVEGAENRAENEAKKAEEEKAAAEKKAAEEKKSAERKVKEAEAAANREVVEEKKHLEEVNAYIKRQRKQKAHDDKKEKARDSRFRKLFWTGKRKLIIPAALIAIILIGVSVYFIAILPYQRWQQEQQSLAEDKAEFEEHEERTKDMLYYQSKKLLEKSEDLTNALDNYDYATVELIYQYYIDKAENVSDKALLYLDEATRIWKTNPDDEKDRIYQLLDTAYSLDSDSLDVAQTLISIYNYYQDYEKSTEVNNHLEMVTGGQIDNTESDDEGRTDG